LGHGHAHHEHGAGARRASRRRLALTLVLVALYMGAEVVGGLLTHSLALLADAGHMLSDAAALALSLFALWIVDRRPPGSLRTYGYYRAEILAALVNGRGAGGHRHPHRRRRRWRGCASRRW
jgi:cobalt-zinc-cadmium efflux system protein